MSLTERDEFIRDVAITAVEGGIGYWASCMRYRWSNKQEGDLDDMLPFPEITIVPAEDENDFMEQDITKETILLGLAQIADPNQKDIGLHDSYRKKIVAAEAFLDACDIDAELADYIVQIGLFGKVIYG
jgi:hypothetical protein